MPELSIVSANVDSFEWAELFVKSVRKFTSTDYEIIIIDNNSLPQNLVWLERQKDIRLIKLNYNSKHGGALDMGTNLARAPYVCFLDIDSHVQRKGWEKDLFELYRSDPKIRLIGVIGPEIKPLHPPLFFYDRNIILEHKLSFEHIPGVSTDTGQKVYWDILKLGFKVERLKKGKKIYPLCHDEIYLNDKPTFYHHWNGTRFNEHNPKIRKAKLDGITIEEHLKGKRLLFSQPLVKEIMKYGEKN